MLNKKIGRNFFSLGNQLISFPTYLLDQWHLYLLSFLGAGVDQYFAILYPLEYSTKVTHRVSWQLISLVWSLGLVSAALGALQLTTSGSPWRVCRAALPPAIEKWGWQEAGHHLRLPRRAWLACLHLTTCYLLPMAALAFIYVRIFFAARRNSRTMRKTSVATVPSAASLHKHAASVAAAIPANVSFNVGGDDDCVFDGVSSSVGTSIKVEDEDEVKPTSPCKKSPSAASRLSTIGSHSTSSSPTPPSSPGEERPAKEEDDSAESPSKRCRDQSSSMVSPPPSQSFGNPPPQVRKSRQRPLSPPIAAFIRARRPRAPKLSHLRAKGSTLAAEIFSRPVNAGATVSLDSTGSNSSSGTARAHILRNRLLQQKSADVDIGIGSSVNGAGGDSGGDASVSSGQGTPRRKCSFSSFSECRLLVDSGDANGTGFNGERHHTFLFSIEAPSPPPSPSPQEDEDSITAAGSECAAATFTASGASQVSLQSRGGLEVPAPPLAHLSASQWRRRFSQSSLSVAAAAAFSGLRTGSEDEKSASGPAPLSKSGSLLSMTSQVRCP